ncbi:MAG: iron-containing alcohol dehydrogenase, partial [Synergistaceae bacterium]|nr:iron-containing alcohol dehydrogenase [Synergistaceae bacterium]
ASTEEAKSRAVIDRLGEMVEHLEIPKSLKEWNVPDSDLESLVASGMEVTRLLNNNRRKVTAEDARKIYQEIM